MIQWLKTKFARRNPAPSRRGEGGLAPGPSRSTVRMTGVIRRLRARYDAAQTTEDNRRHWAAADALSADAAASADVRRTLRMATLKRNDRDDGTVVGHHLRDEDPVAENETVVPLERSENDAGHGEPT